MRKLLYSRWFFLFLAAVCLLDLTADLSELVWGNTDLNYISIGIDFIAVAMSLWIFIDLQSRKPKDGRDSRR